MAFDPLAEYDRRRAARRAQAQTETRQRPQAPEGSSSRVGAWLSDAFWTIDAAVYGAANIITLNYMDEIGATLDTFTFGGGNYEEQLRQHREAAQWRWDNHTYAYGAGAVAGAFTPMGVLSRANTVRGMVGTGAVMGAIDGSGRAEGGLESRLYGAGEGALYGAVGGYVLGAMVIPAVRWGGQRAVSLFRQGRDPELNVPVPAIETAANRVDELAPTPPRLGVAPDAPAPRANIITGQADDVLEDGALLTLRELTGEAGAARTALNRRLGQLTEEQAKQLIGRLETAQANGTVLQDPHYRSLLGIDLSDASVDADLVLRASALLEEATEAVAKRAGLGARTGKQMDAEFARRLEQGVLMEDLTGALENSAKGVIDVNIANHAHMVAGVMFARAKDKYLPLIRKGTEGAKEELAEVLTKAAHLSAIARGIKSNAGRTLQRLQSKSKLAFEEVADDLFEVESVDAIRARVNEAVKQLGDDDLKALLDRVRTLSDIDKLEEVLLNPVRAEEFSMWRRSMNSVSLFLRSNALTPATGLFNTISFVGHDFFRNGLAKRWAARNFAREGKADDALALRFETAVARGVYWKAHREGLKALFGRVKWEFMGEVEKIASVGWGNGAVAKAAKGSRQRMADEGFRIPENREFREKARLAVQDTKAFNQRLATRKIEGGAFGNLMYHVERAAAVAANTVDAAGGAGMKLFTGAIDDWGREFIRLKETYAMSARYAIREALEMGLPEAEALKFAERRAQELAEFPPSEILQKVEDQLLKGQDLDGETRFLLNRDRDIDLEADRTLFMDGPQTGFGRTSANFAAGVDKFVGLGQVEGILLPYIRTPVRLFERGLVSYTPWAKASKEFQTELRAGGVRAEIAKAQMEVGTMGIGVGMVLGLSGALTLTNGGWSNSANLDAGPPNRLNLPGGAYIEIGRLDPFSLTLALGGFVGQAMKDGFQDGSDYDAEQGINTAIQIAWLSLRDSVLEKSYLTGLQDIMEVMFAREGGGALSGVERIIQNAATRMVPFAGPSRQISDTIRGDAPETIGWVDKMLRAIPGGSLFLPDRIDPLGDPVDGRVMGVSLGGTSVDDVKAQLRALEIDISQLNRADPRGFGLTAQELSELRRIRGHEARNPFGQTMREALAELFADPEFQQLSTKDQKHDAVTEVLREFNEDARALYEQRNPNYRANREAHQSLIDYIADGLTPAAAAQRAAADVEAEGLPAPDRL